VNVAFFCDRFSLLWFGLSIFSIMFMG
jgi:hypothetical protein